ncbi:T9SS type A sorting domain-containing protein [Flavitalea sp.]
MKIEIQAALIDAVLWLWDPDPATVYGVSVFPNPASGVLYLRNLDLADQWQSLSITGMHGKPVMIAKDIRGMDRLDLNVMTLPSGMYTLILTSRRRNGHSIKLYCADRFCIRHKTGKPYNSFSWFF